MSKNITKAELIEQLRAAEKRISELEAALKQPSQSAITGQEKEKLARLLEVLPVGVSILDAERKIVYQNPALQRILDITAEGLSTGAYKNRKYLSADGNPMPPDGFASVRADRSGEAVYNVETGIVKENGEAIWTSVSAVPVDLPDWKTVIVTTDVTERKQLETSLHDSERRAGLLFQKSTVPVAVLKLPEVVIADANEAAEKLTGFRREEMLGRTAAELGLISHKQRTEEIARFEKEHALAENERRILTKSGEERIIISNTSPLEIGGQPYAITSLQDVTERKQAEEALERTRSTLTEAQKIAHLGSFEYVAATQTTVWSEEEYRIYGLDPSEPSPEYEVMLQKCIHPEDAARLDETFTRAMQTHSAYELEHRVVRPDGSVRWVYDHARPYFGEQGELVRYLGITLDITERKQIEDKLRESEARYRPIGDNAADVIWVLDPLAGKFTYVSPSVEKLRGYTPQEVMTQPVEAALTPESLKAVSESLAANLPSFIAKGSGTETFITEVDQPCKDGSIVNTEVTTTYLFNEYGKVEIVGVSRNITDRKRVTEALKHSEEKYSALFQKSAVPAALTKMPQGVFADINEAFQRTFGYSREEVIGKTSVEIGMARPEERARTFSDLEKSGLLQDNEKHLFTKSGEARIGLINIGRVTINGQGFVVTTIHDVTERKRAEQALQKSEHRYRELVQNANSAIIRWRSDGTIAFFNEYAQSFFGYSAEEIIGKHVSIIVPQTESSGGDLSGLVKEIVADPGKFTNNVNENVCKDGRRVWMIWSNKPVYNENEGLEEILAVGSDITEQKRIEDELRRSNAELEQFAYVASHDLQEPLRAMAGMVQLLQKRYQGQLDARADEYIGHAVDASTRMQSLIQDLLEYARVNRRGRPIEMVSAETCLKAALKNLDAAIQESHAEIVSDSLPTVHADSTQLTQLFQNLVGNSIKFRRDESPRMSVSVTRVNDTWQFSIRDNGIGIDPQYFERIFLVFQRLHTRREYQGTGIGLALCKKIVERHGGSIWVESQPGEGSTFYFTLPIKE